jgi:molybdopterin-guanine dinucleotide biosynthesis protein A
MLSTRNSVGSAILAGGNNSRYGGMNKALIKIEGEEIILKTKKNLSSIFSEIHIISGRPDDFTNTELPVFPDYFKCIGPLGGIHAALKNSDCEAVFIFSCDTPFLSESLIYRIIQQFKKSNAEILIPCINDEIQPLHAMYSKTIFEKLEQHILKTESYKIRNFFNKVRTVYLPLPDNAYNRRAFYNINSVTDLNGF